MPRTEQEILKDFEDLGYEVAINDNSTLEIYRLIDFLNVSLQIKIYKLAKLYEKNQFHKIKKLKFFTKIEARAGAFDIDEMKLLHELFCVYGWL